MTAIEGESVVVGATHEIAALVAYELAAIAIEAGAAGGANLAEMLNGTLGSVFRRVRTTLRDFHVRFGRLQAAGESRQHG